MTNRRLSLFCYTGEPRQREVRDILSAKVRCTRLRAAGGHYRGETEDGDDGIRLPDGDGLHPEHGLYKKSTEQCKQRPIMSTSIRRRVVPS